MADKKKGPSFAQSFIDLNCKRKTKLDDIKAVINWKSVEKKLQKHIKRTANAVGNPAYPALLMFKSLLLQRLYNLSDVELEDALYNRLDFRRFTDLDIMDDVPDSSTICRFRTELSQSNLGEKLFVLILNQFSDMGLSVKNGISVDASLIQSARRPTKTVDYAVTDRQEDEDEPQNPQIKYSDDSEAAWVVKGKKFTYGYKMHIGVSADSGFILSGHITPANKSDTKNLEEIVRKIPLKTKGRCYADKGYTSKENVEVLQKHRLKNGIMTKAKRGKKLSYWEKMRNFCISSVRGGVERVFGTLKRRYRFDRSRYVGQNKVEQEFFLLAICYNLSRAVKLSAC